MAKSVGRGALNKVTTPYLLGIRDIIGRLTKFSNLDY